MGEEGNVKTERGDEGVRSIHPDNNQLMVQVPLSTKKDEVGGLQPHEQGVLLGKHFAQLLSRR